MLFLPLYHSASHIQSNVAFLNHQVLLLLQIILNANHNVEPPASNNSYIIYRFPGCFQLSRLQAEAEKAKLNYVPDWWSFFFGLGNKSLGNFCCLSLNFLRSLKKGKVSVLSHFYSPQLKGHGTGNPRLLHGELPWGWCC